MFFRDRDPSSDPMKLPVLPLRGVVVFPHAPMSLIVGRPGSVNAVRAAMAANREILLLAQRGGEATDPGPDELHGVGTLAVIDHLLELPDGNLKVVVEARRRVRVRQFVPGAGVLSAEFETPEVQATPGPELDALVRTAKGAFERLVRLHRGIPPEMLIAVNALDDPDRLADTLVSALQLKVEERQELLELFDPMARLERVYASVLAEVEYLQVARKLKTRARRDQDQGQRDQWLNDQMRAIQRELGDKEAKGELEELVQAFADKALPPEVRGRAEKELRKLAQMNQMSAEAAVIRSYLDWFLALPWEEQAGHRPGAEEATAVLDADHFGLARVKERILEHLAVGTLVEAQRGPVLCLVGPPGVGKTSLARSIARATGRPFVRIALGGVRDEAEIRGHRRTYIGAMPGKLLHAMKRAGSVDPVILLDEVDKMSSDFRGDPTAALLEVLDPEQNQNFNDHYLDIDYDLSRVMFVCTANTLQGIPAPLEDRLEVIELSGYTEVEKLAIAERYLVGRQREANGLRPEQLSLTAAALLHIIRGHTRESGVRDLERRIAQVCRKVARRVVHFGPETSVRLTSRNVDRLLGVPRYRDRSRDAVDTVGVVKGLAVSPWGGEVLDIEVATVLGKGQLILTGRLGDWLKESATAGFTYLRSRAEALSLDADFHETLDFHVHYPGNPLKTDGPSAGIAMATALVSAVTGIPVRADTAMTGEISLRGRVLRIGGLKEKILAAHRAGVRRVLIPEENNRDLEDIPENILKEVEVIPVSHMDRVLVEALQRGGSSDLLRSYGMDRDVAVHFPRSGEPSGSPGPDGAGPSSPTEPPPRQ